jgi:hypothetical protein
VTCERCGAALEEGQLLVNSSVFWNHKPTFFLEPRPAFPAAQMGRSYVASPIPLAAARCPSCRWVFVAAGAACDHTREPGYIFPRASLHWFPRSEPFHPGFWFHFNGKSREGIECETLVRKAFVVSVVNTRVEAARCTACGAVAFHP